MVYIIWSQILEKVALTWPHKTLKKLLQKGPKNMKLSAFFSGFIGLNDSSYQFFEATFQQSVFPKL